MKWPTLVNQNVTCPACGVHAAIEALHLPEGASPAKGVANRKPATWAACPACHHEWEVGGGETGGTGAPGSAS